MLFRGAGSELGQAIAARRGEHLHVAGTLSIDQWQGQRRPAMRIIDAAKPA
jgi:single-stranded-DNA-specific exonuclease